MQISYFIFVSLLISKDKPKGPSSPCVHLLASPHRPQHLSLPGHSFRIWERDRKGRRWDWEGRYCSHGKACIWGRWGTVGDRPGKWRCTQLEGLKGRCEEGSLLLSFCRHTGRHHCCPVCVCACVSVYLGLGMGEWICYLRLKGIKIKHNLISSIKYNMI